MARPKMPMGGMNMNAMLRQAQKMQADIENAKTELDAREYEFSAGGGAVSVKMNGKHELVGISILPDAIDPDDADMLCELIRTAVNGALAAAKEDESKTLGRFSGAMGGLL
ncbi:MAG: YbaB/EbfC family nucleoid-associated protein [Oscillospiraceae bacterium]|nr:YbaB/EbfC family nucleoid-associated protein [Oscillospiraceae bacterium]